MSSSEVPEIGKDWTPLDGEGRMLAWPFRTPEERRDSMNPRYIAISRAVQTETLAHLAGRLEQWLGLVEQQVKDGFVVFGRKSK